MKGNFFSRIVVSRLRLYVSVFIVLMISTLPVMFVYKNTPFWIEIIISIVLTPLFAEWMRWRYKKSLNDSLNQRNGRSKWGKE